ncbi:MAG TPA: DUF1206 domain-containing protein [Solirubrobacteraceae bacterium]|jgi:hypothetical protein|nr:DUF1206 domain-containing protein [Solirubrobacteraceae bacterium]
MRTAVTALPRARRAAGAAGPGALGWLARAGLAARGFVYGIIGVLAIKLAIGAGGATTNQQGALQTVAQQPFGKALLVALAVGLAGYALWRLEAAAFGHASDGRNRAFDRIAAAGSGLVYAALCVVAVKVLAGAGAGGGSGAPKKATAGVLGWSGGPELVGIAGVVLVGAGLFQAYKGLTRAFMKESAIAKMAPGLERAFEALGVLGHLARAVVFGLTGYGLLEAAIDFDPRKAIGLDGALRDLVNASYGPLLLGIVAAGLISFALYSIADARYHKV